MLIVKKAAMFGLDARIALAIFGALSVIAGASLYSVLDNIETVTTYQNLKEITKASEQYFLDTRKYIKNINNDYHLSTEELLVNNLSVKGWKGPYIQYKRVDNLSIESKLNFSSPINIRIYQYGNDAWSATETNKPVYCTVDKEGCYEFLLLDGTDTESSLYLNDLYKKLDKKYDNSDGPCKGEIRRRIYTANSNINLYFRGILRVE